MLAVVGVLVGHLWLGAVAAKFESGEVAALAFFLPGPFVAFYLWRKDFWDSTYRAPALLLSCAYALHLILVIAS